MKIELRAIGKNHDVNFKGPIQLFTDRIKHYFPVEWKIIPPSRLPQQKDAIAAETQILFQRQPGDIVVALDERGKQLSSVKLAAYIEKQSLESVKNLIFLIGGAYGMDQQLVRSANFVWSLSDLTFPHQMVRLILAEQVYRACTIIRGEGYHHR